MSLFHTFQQKTRNLMRKTASFFFSSEPFISTSFLPPGTSEIQFHGTEPRVLLGLSQQHYLEKMQVGGAGRQMHLVTLGKRLFHAGPHFLESHFHQALVSGVLSPLQQTL